MCSVDAVAVIADEQPSAPALKCVLVANAVHVSTMSIRASNSHIMMNACAHLLEMLCDKMIFSVYDDQKKISKFVYIWKGMATAVVTI